MFDFDERYLLADSKHGQRIEIGIVVLGAILLLLLGIATMLTVGFLLVRDAPWVFAGVSACALLVYLIGYGVRDLADEMREWL